MDPRTIQVTSCLDCPFLGGDSNHWCVHKDGPNVMAVSRAILVTTVQAAKIAEGCPLRERATLVQLKGGD